MKKLGLLVLLSTVMFVGCGKEKEKTEDNNKEVKTEKKSESKEKAKQGVDKDGNYPLVKDLKVGDSVLYESYFDEKVNFTLNNIYIHEEETIDGMKLKLFETGDHYLVFNITLENLGEEAFELASIMDFIFFDGGKRANDDEIYKEGDYLETGKKITGNMIYATKERKGLFHQGDTDEASPLSTYFIYDVTESDLEPYVESTEQ